MRAEGGTATTEVVLVFPVAFVLVLTVFQFALWYNARQLVTAAAQDGVAAGRVEGGTLDASRARAAAVLERSRPALDGSPQITATGDGTRVAVEVQGRVVAVVPGLRLDVTGTAEAPVERFVPAGQR